ncbi:MAG: tetratricopeptide repeat protein [Gemmatimonadota bacterium]
MGDLLHKLAERRLVQTTAVYAGGAWLLLEATDFFVDNYALSPRMLDIAVLLIVLGFPAALIIAWYHGEKGRQQVARTEASLLVTLAVLAAIGTYRTSVAGEAGGHGGGANPAVDTRTASGANAALGETSLAVLPFVNSTGHDSLDWLGPGLSDMLTSSLARTGNLKVVSPQRLFELLREAGRSETELIPDDVAMNIASASGARRMVRGSILGQPGDLAIEAQLIDLQDGTIVAAERVRGDDVFVLSDSVALLLSTRVVVAAGQRPGPSERSDRGLYAGRKPGETPRPALALVGDMDKLKEFQVGLRRTWDSLGTDSIGARYRMVELLEQVPGREEEVRTALEEIVSMDPQQARAWSQLARVAVVQGDEDAADEALEHYVSVVKDPGRARLESGRVYESMGRLEAARAQYRAALAIDPADHQAMSRLSNSYLRQGDPAGARTSVDPWITNPDPGVRAEAFLLTGDAWAWEGRFDRALEAYAEVERIGNAEDRAEIRADGLEGSLAVQSVRDSTWSGNRLGRYRSVWTLLELGRVEEARNVIEAAERVQVTEADRVLPVDYHVILYARARVFEALGNDEIAIASYGELLQDWGDSIDALPKFRDAPERLAALRR